MKTIDEARTELKEAREALRVFHSELTFEQVMALTQEDEATVEILGLKNSRTVLLEKIIAAEEGLRNAKKAETQE